MADKERKARLEADERREQAQALALRVQYEHFFAKAEKHPELMLVGMASLLPAAARLKDRSILDLLSLEVGAWSERAARLQAIYSLQNDLQELGTPRLHSSFAMAWSADRKSVLTVSADNSARLWEMTTGKPIGPPLQHDSNKVTGVALSADGKTALTVAVKISRLWQVPQPLRGDPERIKLWAQVITGLKVDERTAAHVLDAATWQERRRQLEKLGGPPEDH